MEGTRVSLPMEHAVYRNSSSRNVYSLTLVRLFAAACVSFAGCAGPVLLKEVRPIESTESVAEGKDARIHASIETVTFRNFPDSLARHAGWDEYLIRIRALSEEPVEITGITIFDALDHRIEPRSTFGELVKGSQEIAQRYEQSGDLVRDGNVNGWVVAGAGVAVAAALVGSGAPMPRDIGGRAGSAVVVITALAGLVEHRELISELRRARTKLPMALPDGAEVRADLLFPITPLSARAQVVYADRYGEHRLKIDTREALMNLENASPRLRSRPAHEFPVQAGWAGITEGYVKARLAVDCRGSVQKVELIKSVPTHVFDREARRILLMGIYNHGRRNLRTAEETLYFKK